MTTRIVSYDQPHRAELRVHLDSGKSWLATFHVESRKTSGGLDLEERCLVFPTENDGSGDDAAHLAAAWQRADRLRLGWGLARVFGPYNTVRDADKAARHPQLWVIKDDHSDYVHTDGVLPQPGTVSPQETS